MVTSDITTKYKDFSFFFFCSNLIAGSFPLQLCRRNKKASHANERLGSPDRNRTCIKSLGNFYSIH